ncbi:MAG: UvrD-helicase domain-containing protein [Anaerotardibacter sp.]
MIDARTILDGCSPYQEAIVKTLDKPLMVSAGAGSGKTFTLTQRIAYAFCPQEDTGKPYLNSIDEIMAITFTTKAAAELKSRFKAKLLDMGLTEEALKVDDAWVSTIHGMCSRVLKENAFVIGLDPSFSVVQGAEEDALKYQALEQCVSYVQNNPSLVRLNKLIRTHNLYSAGGFDSSSLSTMINSLMSRINTNPSGFESLTFFAPTSTPSEILKQLIMLGEQMVSVMDENEEAKSKKLVARNYYAIMAALQSAYEVLDEFEGTSFEDEDFDADTFASTVYAFPITSEKFTTTKDYADFFYGCRCELTTLFEEAEAGCDYNFTVALIELARMYKETYEGLLGPNRLDNNLLLLKTYQALRDYPEISARYRDHFKLIMIDEFQDTDLLQVAIISMLAKPDKSNVCTVGDAQQSIYRFRGADVNVFFDYQKKLSKENPETRLLTLPDNFRSHAEVLATVESIFSLETAFGDAFLKLNPKGNVNKVKNSIFDEKKRISLHLCESRAKKSTSQDSSILAAQKIAEHFTELRDVYNVSPGEMVILFGSMNKAELYANALSAAGFESIFTGGSLFKDSPEVTLLCDALSYAANPYNSKALLNLLQSELFNLTDKCILALVSSAPKKDYGEDSESSSKNDSVQETDEPQSMRAKLVRGFSAPQSKWLASLSETEAAAVTHAKQCLSAYLTDSSTLPAAAALKNLLQNSGVLVRYQSQGARGLAKAGNVLKALEYVESIAKESTGLASLAQDFVSHVEGLKETPGVLSTSNSNYVRLMTIHSSKGLQFPHVAVAEIGGSNKRLSSLLVENIEGSSYINFASKPKGMDHSAVAKLQTWTSEEDPVSVPEAQNAAEQKRALSAYVKTQEAKETQRLFYVALTRAVESLCIALSYQGNRDFDYTTKPLIFELFCGLTWIPSETAPKQVVSFGPYQADLTLSVILEHLAEPELAFEQKCFAVPDYEIKPATSTLYTQTFSFHPERDGVFSYSSISSEEHDEEVEANYGMEGPAEHGTNGVAGADNADELRASAWGQASFEAGGHGSKIYAETHEQNEQFASNFYDFDNEEPFIDEELLLNQTNTAVLLGSAFHRVAQYAIEIAAQTEAKNLILPGPSIVEAQAKQWELTPDQRLRLDTALTWWFSSDIAQAFAQHRMRAAEVPFMVSFSQEEIKETAPALAAMLEEKALLPERIYLEGEIDGLAFNEENGKAYLIDYKTGGYLEETAEQLTQKHGLQASCYAYALLTQGFSSVEAHFVRVEQQNEINFTFDQSDLLSLKERIITSYLKGLLPHE